MSDHDPSKEFAKAAKKRAKARFKIEKRLAKEGEAGDHANSRAEGAFGEKMITPAERSAAAAERQVRLQWLRVVIALAAVIIALASLSIALRGPVENRTDERSEPVPITGSP